MTFNTGSAPVPHPKLTAEKRALMDAAHKLTFSPEYKLLLAHVRQQAYKLLNDDLGSVDARNDHNRGRLYQYKELYALLSNGKDLFDAAP